MRYDIYIYIYIYIIRRLRVKVSRNMVARSRRVYISMAILTAWYNFTRRDHFYDDLMSPAAIKCFFFSSVIGNQSTWVLYELMCWPSLVVRSPPARRSLSWIQSTVDWCMAPHRWGFDLKSNSTNYPDHGHHGDPSPTRRIPMVEPGIEPGTSWLVARSCDH